MLDAIRHLEEAVTGAGWLEGVVLRYGGFYGPGTTLSGDPAAAHTMAIRKRQFPVVGDGGGIWSFIHVDDARRPPRSRSSTASLDVERRGRRPRSGAGLDARAGARAGRQAAAARAALARSAPGG